MRTNNVKDAFSSGHVQIVDRLETLLKEGANFFLTGLPAVGKYELLSAALGCLLERTSYVIVRTKIPIAYDRDRKNEMCSLFYDCLCQVSSCKPRREVASQDADVDMMIDQFALAVKSVLAKGKRRVVVVVSRFDDCQHYDAKTGFLPKFLATVCRLWKETSNRRGEPGISFVFVTRRSYFMLKELCQGEVWESLFDDAFDRLKCFVYVPLYDSNEVKKICRNSGLSSTEILQIEKLALGHPKLLRMLLRNRGDAGLVEIRRETEGITKAIARMFGPKCPEREVLKCYGLLRGDDGAEGELLKLALTSMKMVQMPLEIDVAAGCVRVADGHLIRIGNGLEFALLLLLRHEVSPQNCISKMLALRKWVKTCDVDTPWIVNIDDKGMGSQKFQNEKRSSKDMQRVLFDLRSRFDESGTFLPKKWNEKSAPVCARIVGEDQLDCNLRDFLRCNDFID